MVSLSTFRQDATAINQGEWVSPGEEYGDLEILSRGFNDAYFDLRAALERKAARRLRTDIDALPAAERRAITVECVRKTIVLDVRNLEHDIGARKGQPVTLEEFREMLADPDLAELTVACLKAASKVGVARKADMEEAVGNLSRPSAATSTAE